MLHLFSPCSLSSFSLSFLRHDALSLDCHSWGRSKTRLTEFWTSHVVKPLRASVVPGRDESARCPTNSSALTRAQTDEWAARQTDRRVEAEGEKTRFFLKKLKNVCQVSKKRMWATPLSSSDAGASSISELVYVFMCTSWCFYQTDALLGRSIRTEPPLTWLVTPECFCYDHSRCLPCKRKVKR